MRVSWPPELAEGLLRPRVGGCPGSDGQVAWLGAQEPSERPPPPMNSLYQASEPSFKASPQPLPTPLSLVLTWSQGCLAPSYSLPYISLPWFTIGDLLSTPTSFP